MDEEKNKKREQHRTAIKIRASLENLDTLIENIPNLSPEMKKGILEKINDAKKEILPFVQDSVKSIFSTLSGKLGTGRDKKIWVLRNGNEGLEYWIMKNMRAFDGDVVLKYPLQIIYDRIDKYQKPESLIADTLSGRLFSLDDYEIEGLPPVENKEPTVTEEGSYTEVKEPKLIEGK